jgi:OOP family OmpA-OmpF porin
MNWPSRPAPTSCRGALKIQVAGHTDSVGDAAKNKDLSERRAATVKKALVDKYGADVARITTKGWGAEQPVLAR